MKLLTLIRRSLTRRAMLGLLGGSEWLSRERCQSLGRALGRAALQLPYVVERLRVNLRRAGVDDLDAVIRKYFHNMGLWIGESLGVFARGFDADQMARRIHIDEKSLRYLEESFARGRGVVLACPHLFGHELAAGLVSRRYPLTVVVRESKDRRWEPVKQRWYNEVLGLEIVRRPRRETVSEEMHRMVGLLRSGRILAITPDVITSRNSLKPVRMFDRPVKLSPGLILLSKRTNSPLITSYGYWDGDPWRPGPSIGRVFFTEPLELIRQGNLESQLHDGLQRWCDWFEHFLRNHPAEWQFWLDKNWSRHFRLPRLRGGGQR